MKNINRIIKQGEIGECQWCGSSLYRKWWGLWKTGRCINPDCRNYWKIDLAKADFDEDDDHVLEM